MSSADPHHPAPVGREFCPSPEDLLPFAPDGLPEIAGGWAEREFELADRTFRLTLPAAPDALLDSPDVLAAHERDGYMPYWGYLWPTSLDMGTAVLREKWKPGLPTLEIGSGIGLVGLAGLAAGLQLVFSDYDPQSVRLALFNAAQNGFSQARGMMV
ncbi:MAG TPA: hypothetical protein VHB77_01850, partial [Planctomycetaceae bacterium]|nr:hypothetical protein [Planctomycetaceae bacterium]